MKYFHPKSGTWWVGILFILMGLTLLICKTCNVGEFADVMTALAGGGDSSPATMILMGAGFIGIRDKLERL